MSMQCQIYSRHSVTVAIVVICIGTIVSTTIFYINPGVGEIFFHPL